MSQVHELQDPSGSGLGANGVRILRRTCKRTCKAFAVEHNALLLCARLILEPEETWADRHEEESTVHG
eukprot:2298823-Rhodomonas_salina.1